MSKNPKRALRASLLAMTFLVGPFFVSCDYDNEGKGDNELVEKCYSYEEGETYCRRDFAGDVVMRCDGEKYLGVDFCEFGCFCDPTQCRCEEALP